MTFNNFEMLNINFCYSFYAYEPKIQQIFLFLQTYAIYVKEDGGQNLIHLYNSV